MEYQNLLVSSEGPAAIITLNRPKANALSLDLMVELKHAVDAANANNDVRVIIITGGEGKFFAAGADIPSLQGSLHNPLEESGMLARGLQTIEAIDTSSKPVIAAVNGLALGGGCEICLACHLRIAADIAVFGQPEINLGIIPGWGGMHRLPLLIGESRARDWLLTGRQVSASEALEAGLVCKVVPAEALRAAALELAAVLASKPAVAVAQTLSILRQRALTPARGAELEAEGFKACAASQDAAEGIAAFLEKRPARFTGN
jgi:enoyl-CoA hydratase